MNEYVIGTMTPLGVVLCFLIATALVLMGAYSLINIATTLIARRIYTAIILFVFDIFAYYTVFEVSKAAYSDDTFSTPLGQWFGNIPPWVRWVVMIVLLTLGALRVIWVSRIMKTTITQFSVGDTLDLIPLGVAFSNDYGQVMQANTTINNLCFEMTGDVLTNEKDFWDKISTGNLRQGFIVSSLDLTDMTTSMTAVGGMASVSGSENSDKLGVAGDASVGTYIPETPIIAMPDGTIWLFVKTLIASDVGLVSQILAIDATEEEKLVQELNQSNEQLREMNRRLRRYHEEVDDTVRSEELLEAKMRVHDKMGETLLAAKMYLTNPDSPVDGEGVLKSWEQDLVLLREDTTTDEGPRQIERFMNAAKHLGVELQLIGEMPGNREVMNLICVGIQECMTNAIQHSEANQLYVTIMKDDFAYTVNYSDNGKTPKYPIKEGGGLRLIRETAEKMNATMTYIEGRHFHLALEIPKPDSDL